MSFKVKQQKTLNELGIENLQLQFKLGSIHQKNFVLQFHKKNNVHFLELPQTIVPTTLLSNISEIGTDYFRQNKNKPKRTFSKIHATWVIARSACAGFVKQFICEHLGEFSNGNVSIL